MKNVTLCGGSGTRSRFRLGSPKYRAVPVVKIGKCANGWNRREAAGELPFSSDRAKSDRISERCCASVFAAELERLVHVPRFVCGGD